MLFNISLRLPLKQDPDILRICVETSRPSQTDKSKGKIPVGLYLRDIGEVREGATAFDFLKSSDAPEYDAQCLALIGSERAICLQLPSKVHVIEIIKTMC